MPKESDLPKVIDNDNVENRKANEKEAAGKAFHDELYESRKGGSNGSKLDDRFKNEQGDSLKGQIGREKLDSLINKRDDLESLFRKQQEPTKEEIKKAEDKLDDTMSPLVSAADRKLAQAISHSLLEGDGKGLSDALAQL